ncbi:Uncharacterised protein [Vibrio cholerae]|nr:Uncharacterised protein [Vibrio cholerae]
MVGNATNDFKNLGYIITMFFQLMNDLFCL